MTKFEINEGSEKKPKGLVDGGKVDMTCVDCGKLLMVFQLVQSRSQAQVLTQVAVKCGFCDGCSRIEQLTGQFYSGAADDNIVFDIVDNHPEVKCDVCFKAWPKCKQPS